MKNTIHNALCELNALISNDNMFRERQPNMIMGPVFPEKRPDFVPLNVPAARIPVPTGFLFKALRGTGGLDGEKGKALAAAFAKCRDFVMKEKLFGMGLPFISNGGALNSALACENGFCDLDMNGSADFDIPELPILWLWHDGGDFFAKVDWPGVWEPREISLGRAVSSSVIAARLYYGFYLLSEPDEKKVPCFQAIKRKADQLCAILEENGVDWIARGCGSDGGRFVVYMTVPPGRLAEFFSGKARKWLEMCELARRCAWSLLRLVERDAAPWLEKMAKGENSDILRFLTVASRDFFKGCFEFAKPGGANVMPMIAAVRDSGKFKDEGLGFTGDFTLAAVFEPYGDFTGMTLGVYSGLPILSESEFDGASFDFEDDALDMKVSKSAICAKDEEALGFRLLWPGFARMLASCRLPEFFEKIVDQFYEELGKAGC